MSSGYMLGIYTADADKAQHESNLSKILTLYNVWVIKRHSNDMRQNISMLCCLLTRTHGPESRSCISVYS